MKLKYWYIAFLQVFLCTAGSLGLQGQVEFPGRPLGINRQLKAARVIYTLPPPDPLEIAALRESARNRVAKPLPFAIIRPVNLNPEMNGSWSLEGDQRIWRVHLISPGAYSLGVNFNAWQLQPGVKVFVYDPSQTRVKGALTSGNNKSSGMLPVGHIPGQEVVIEMQVPLDMQEYGELELESLSHAFLDLKHVQGPAACDPGIFDCSQACEIDVNCVEGDDWWMVKPSVVRIYINKTSISEYCTGVLVNNTSYDGTPYVLTAQHCIANQSHATGSTFQFNYESAECFGEDGPLNMSISTSDLMSVGDSIDFSLVKLSVDPPPSYGVYYAGWDRSEFQTTPSTTIHHPWGDVKKITFDEDEAPYIPSQPDDVPYSDLQDYHYFSFWWIKRWEIGTTEGGSSGGPLFNQGGRVIGTLSGGRARCGDSIGYDAETDRVIYNNVFNYDDYFTRFGMSWDYEDYKGNTLSEWLDPSGTGAETIGGYNPSSVEELPSGPDERYRVFPNPSSGLCFIEARQAPPPGTRFLLRSVSGALLMAGELDYGGRATLDTGTLPRGIYVISVGMAGDWEHYKLMVIGR